jgi:hypothetical protein
MLITYQQCDAGTLTCTHVSLTDPEMKHPTFFNNLPIVKAANTTISECCLPCNCIRCAGCRR